jgi:hypothetical protein
MHSSQNAAGALDFRRATTLCATVIAPPANWLITVSSETLRALLLEGTDTGQISAGTEVAFRV